MPRGDPLPAAEVPPHSGGLSASLRTIFEQNERHRESVALPFRFPRGGRGPGWISDNVFKGRVLEYGLSRRPQRWIGLLHQPSGPHAVQADLVTWLAHQLKTKQKRANNDHPIQYLELGVATLKCFDTQVQAISNATLTAFDIEDPNWTRAALWGPSSKVATWPADAIRHAHGRNDSYLQWWPSAPNGNSVYYVSGSLFEEESWKAFRHRREHDGLGDMELILSDAVHSPQGVVIEVEKLLKHGLVFSGKSPQPFAMVWDDCGYWPATGNIFDAVQTKVIPQLISAAREKHPRTSFWSAAMFIGGLYGKNEVRHPTCLLTNLDVMLELQAELAEMDAADAFAFASCPHATCNAMPPISSKSSCCGRGVIGNHTAGGKHQCLTSGTCDQKEPNI
jgi:hypothetical protein